MRLINTELFIDLNEMEDNIYLLTVESPTMFFSIIKNLKSQLEGYDGKFVLSDNNKPIEIKKYLQLIMDPFSLNLSDKKVLSKIQELIIAQSVDEVHFEETTRMIKSLDSYANLLCLDFDGDVILKEQMTPSKLVKMLNIVLDYSYESFEEMILEYVLAYQKYLGFNVFCFVNLLEYLETDQLKKLITEFKNNHIAVILLESHDSSRDIKDFKKIIIDKDLCQI